MKEQVRYIVRLDLGYTEDVIADEKFYVRNGFVEFYSNDKFLVMYNVDRVLKIEVE